MKLVPVILAGGQGSRLWPLSTPDCPKQYLPLLDPHWSLLQQTLQRAQQLSPCQPLLVCHEEQRFLAAEQCRAAGIHATLLLERDSRNTAQALALAAQFLRARGDDNALMLVLPADHLLENMAPLQQALQHLQPWVEQGAAAVFGILPDTPATGFGYLQVSAGEAPVRPLRAFHEKPDATTAAAYLQENATGPQPCWYWNSGMLCWQVQSFLQALQQWQPQLATASAAAIAGQQQDLDFIRPNAAALQGVTALPVDIALLEPLAANGEAAVVAAVLADSGWSDIGSWAAVQALAPADEQGNAQQGGGRFYRSHNNYLHNHSGRDIALLGVTDLVVVDTADALLIAQRDALDQLCEAVADSPATSPRKVFRPWGCYEILHPGDGYKIKRLQVKPGGQLSLQRHQQRAEHWVVVRGEATVIRQQDGELTQEILHANESTFIALGDVHALANHGNTLLEMIEVQSGEYLGEDDIERLQDIYGRE
ncbi:mannose-1-phosphate guanylyltransferase/mannose-6-phosphate isomerase [Venatoribacter cucullus]|uniref:mannose-1-phosphate guanylyltransferase/mannose-6-phosphate isomerase n=1 Tax=Venatoribacter cucullus TaxID=2661630 RepID=UPI00223F66C8|nr:mannose-1-phosphate guanylyltransferase/mannose-6-phosphate isomerase [Venatoribacter cucullus]UZK04446.1 mannose-1-phosphate guanylyltransferase/mannose-6-phosphate isomerase [Venatoribacter cucullus]